MELKQNFVRFVLWALLLGYADGSNGCCGKKVVSGLGDLDDTYTLLKEDPVKPEEICLGKPSNLNKILLKLQMYIIATYFFIAYSFEGYAQMVVSIVEIQEQKKSTASNQQICPLL